MQIELVRTVDPVSLDEIVKFKGEFSMRDLENLNLTKFDHALLRQCGASTLAEDWLLALEMLFRRHRQASGEAKGT